MQPSDDHTSNEQPCGATGNMNNVQPASGSQTSSANSSPKSDRSSLSDMVAPGPGTEHHQRDLDFNRKAASCQESMTEHIV
nr:hypothetical protein BaRGS_006721 [Batillaria attramentaria]